jgi:galactokinase
MYRIVQGSTGGLADVDEFLRLLNNLDQHPVVAARGLFDPTLAMVVARAPGRLDVMGGIADYSGSLVLQLPIREATLAAVQRQPERRLRIVSLGAEGDGRQPLFEMELAELEDAGRPVAYETARACFRRDAATAWAAYAAGAFLVLMRERGVRFPDGARILISSDVPEGKGVSSSAAIEVAVMQAVTGAYGLSVEPRELAILCQKVENLVVGAPCGVMDQMTAACGQAGRLLALLCQPAELREPVEIPEDVEVWGLDSGVRHSVSGADYGSVRVGAFMGYRMIAEMAGLVVEGGGGLGEPARVIDPIWQGYLANVTPSLFEQRFAARLPERMRGDAFLSRYRGTTDTVTRVDPEREYAVREPAAHPIYEHSRVQAFAKHLEGATTDEPLGLLGELMYQSHASYSVCGLGCRGTDLLVDLIRQAGPARGLFGAKITGGGSGGTVAVLGRRGSSGAIRAIVEEYERQTGYRPYVFSGSSPGAAEFGQLRLAGA